MNQWPCGVRHPYSRGAAGALHSTSLKSGNMMGLGCTPRRVAVVCKANHSCSCAKAALDALPVTSAVPILPVVPILPIFPQLASGLPAAMREGVTERQIGYAMAWRPRLTKSKGQRRRTRFRPAGTCSANTCLARLHFSPASRSAGIYGASQARTRSTTWQTRVCEIWKRDRDGNPFLVERPKPSLALRATMANSAGESLR